jgi:crossover junction endodeoxyribonuclease RuvC
VTHIVIGIDPGLSGAIAMMTADSIRVTDIPTNLKGGGSGKVKNEVNASGFALWLRETVDGQGDEVLVVIERVSSMPGQGVASMLSLGDTVGAIRGVVAAKGYPIAWVTPAKWKRHYGLGSDKELARARAIEMYPSVDLSRKKDHNKAEAMLIAKYGWDVLR